MQSGSFIENWINTDDKGVCMSEDLNTEVAILKREVADIKLIFNRLDTAIERITEVSSSVNRMLAVHEEKIANQEEVATRANQEFTVDIRELHSRITTNSKELTDMISRHHKEYAVAYTHLTLPTILLV